MIVEKVVDIYFKDFKKYGFDNLKLIVEVIFSDGKKVIFYFGLEIFIIFIYYLMKKGDLKVYVVWINYVENFIIKFQKFLSVKILEIDI